MIKQPRDEWGPRACPYCGAEPWVYCRSASGKKAGLPHKTRWPERPIGVYGRRKRRREELQDLRKLRNVHNLPVGQALKTIEETTMAAFRRRTDG